MKTAILFSGQGAQYVNMGIDFIESVPNLRTRLKKMSKILQMDLEALLKDDKKINDTLYTQPLMVAVEILIHDYLKELGLKVDGYTGFSLGEFSALYASNFYDEDAILKLIKKRAELMQEASINNPGSMAAILSLSDSDVEKICKEVSTNTDIVVAANYNSDGQLVISGSRLAVEKAVTLAKEKGARRAMMLNVSGAFHSPYMKEAGIKLKAYAKEFEIDEPKSITYKNTDAKVLNKNEVLEEIENQISSPVYFKQTIENMLKDGFTRFIEVGPGQVLTGLLKKITPESQVYNVSKFTDLANLKEIIK
ncbi:ACP S-malonyltransferase [Acholeplasma granularum]|uniref:ACP S-malonyltransferase n=1 Tax=Acholeplasma granularum TaxID=264635 RepID=UPI0004B0B01E|nr:ACP S-malonyltransferase [Acholeplasma granularum]